MLTLFAIPKAFRGQFDRIQRNAIASWTLLQPKPEIILLGDDEGTAEVAREFNLKHVANIQRNAYGTPLMNSMFEVAQQVGTGPLFAYVNADIMLLSDFMQTLQHIRFKRFMLTGQRWNLEFEDVLVPSTNWEAVLRDRVTQSGVLEGPQAMDYFVFTRNTYTDIPPFAIGRLRFDNWMLYKAFNLGVPVVDATEAITAIHQNHDYNHHPEGRQGVFFGPEAEKNLQLLGGGDYAYFMLDLANWQITPTGLRRPALTWQRLDRQLGMLPLARPRLKPIAQVLLHLLRSRNQLPTVASKLRKIPARIICRFVKAK